MSQIRDHITQAFDSWADRYDETMKGFQYFSPTWIAKHFHDLDGIVECRVLDLACGTGLNVRALCEQRAGIRADGIDVSPKMLEHALASNRYERLYTHDLNDALPDIPSDTFDLVIAFGFLELLSDISRCLSECRRVLKVNGTLWASFQRFEAGDDLSPPRQLYLGGIDLTGYSADEILRTMNSLDLRVTTLDTVFGYVTETGFACPFYVLSARKAQ